MTSCQASNLVGPQRSRASHVALTPGWYQLSMLCVSPVILSGGFDMFRWSRDVTWCFVIVITELESFMYTRELTSKASFLCLSWGFFWTWVAWSCWPLSWCMSSKVMSRRFVFVTSIQVKQLALERHIKIKPANETFQNTTADCSSSDRGWAPVDTQQDRQVEWSFLGA